MSTLRSYLDIRIRNTLSLHSEERALEQDQG